MRLRLILSGRVVGKVTPEKLHVVVVAVADIAGDIEVLTAKVGIDYASDTPAVSVPVTVTVSNVISFPNYFSRVFGNQMWIYAETIPNAAYQIDMYDENTNYLGSFVDYADGGGYISFLWDLTDGNGHTFDSTNFYGVFTVDTSSLSSMSLR